jgi:uncharacterized membrane protein
MRDTLSRPKIRPELSLLEKILQLLCIVITIATVVILIVMWNGLPEHVPTHFALSGIPDGYSVKTGLLSIPIIMFLIEILITVLERFPYIYNFPIDVTENNAAALYQVSREMLTFLKALTAAMFSFIIFSSVLTAKGIWHGLPFYFAIITIVPISAVIVIYMIRMYKLKDEDAEEDDDEY